MAVISSNDVKVRKPHACIWCGEKIEKGQMAHVQNIAEDGLLSSIYIHQECYAAASSLPTDEHIDGFEPYAYKRGSTEER